MEFSNVTWVVNIKILKINCRVKAKLIRNSLRDIIPLTDI